MLWAAAYGSNRNAVAHCLHGQTGGGYLTLGKFVSSVWVALDAAGLVAKNFVKNSGNSFRIGPATTATQCGIQDAMIKTLGRWESLVYTQLFGKHLRCFARCLTHC